MDPWFGAVHDATIDLLAAAGYSVTVPESQTCCGALAAHDGAAEAAHRLAEQNVAAFKGFDVVVVNSAGCGAHLKQYGHWAGTAGAEFGDRVRDVTEVVAASIDAGLLPGSRRRKGVGRRPGPVPPEARPADHSSAEAGAPGSRLRPDRVGR